MENNWKEVEWQGVKIHTMTERWLNNIRKWIRNNYPNHPQDQYIRYELKRRRKKHKGLLKNEKDK